jgi:hypothetical protein
MTTVAFRIGLLALLAMALAPATASWAQDKCTDCHNQKFRECMALLNSSRPASTTAGQPAPVEASGQSLCPKAARDQCLANGSCKG